MIHRYSNYHPLKIPNERSATIYCTDNDDYEYSHNKGSRLEYETDMHDLKYELDIYIPQFKKSTKKEYVQFQ